MDLPLREPRRHRWRRSLRMRVIGILVLVSTLPVVFLGGFGFWIARREAAEREVISLATQNRQLAAFVDKYLASNTQVVKFLAEAAEMRSFLGKSPAPPDVVAQMNRWLDHQKDLAPDLMAAFLLDGEGTCVASSQPAWVGDSYAFRTYFKDAMQGQIRLTDLCIGKSERQPCVFIAAPIRTGNQILGVIGLKISVERIRIALADAGMDTKNAFIINPDGIVLIHSKPSLEFNAIAPLPESTRKRLAESRQFAGVEIGNLNMAPSFQAAFAKVSSTPDGIAMARYPFGGRSRLAVFSRLTEEPWVMSAAVDESTIYTHSRRILAGAAAVAGVTLLFVIAGGVLFARKVLRPLERLARTMDRFAAGDSKARASTVSGDEVSRLGGSFNAMAEVIDAQREELESKVDQLEGILPICASCKKIRNAEGEYEPIERYISTRTAAQFSHGLCRDCAQKLYPEVFQKEPKQS